MYGGAAGSGKSALAVGSALMKHRRSLLLRRQANQCVELVDQLKRAAGTDGWRGSNKNGYMQLSNGVNVEVGGCDHEDEKTKYMGRPHDLIVFDEATEFTLTQVRFISAWNRHEDPNQLCQIIYPTNPPTTPEGRWILVEFAPWIDSEYPYPAQPGEKRWFTVLDDVTIWTDPNTGELLTAKPFTCQRPDGRVEEIKPRSRTFIPGRLSDNPDLARTDYMSKLQALPEPLRSQMLYGDFSIGQEDDVWQVIPTAWVRAAFKRWKSTPPTGEKQSCVAVDVARGGKDKTVISRRHGPWFNKLLKYPGRDTPNGQTVANLCIRVHEGDCPIAVDVTGGFGGSPFDFLSENTWHKTIGVNNSERTEYKGRGNMHFKNVRAASYWSLREALDPEQGEDLALPPDNELLADLTVPRYKVEGGRIQVEKKEDIIKRVGRSPDCGDSVVIAWWADRSVKRLGMPRFLSLRSTPKGAKPIRILILTREELANLIVDDETGLIVSIEDPLPVKEVMSPGASTDVGVVPSVSVPARVQVNEGGAQPPSVVHGFRELADTVHLRFADLLPTDCQASWGEPIPPWGRPANEVFASRQEHGKRAWRTILNRKAIPRPTVWVFVDDGNGRRALSMATAVCDALSLPRDSTLWIGGRAWSELEEEPPVNKFVYDETRGGRHLVID